MQLSIQNVGKQYSDEVWGLQDFSLEINPGIIGLLGPNGAGKSTLMSIIATVTRPSAGSVFWNSTDIVHDPNAVREVQGYLPQEFGVYPHLSADEFLA